MRTYKEIMDQDHGLWGYMGTVNHIGDLQHDVDVYGQGTLVRIQVEAVMDYVYDSADKDDFELMKNDIAVITGLTAEEVEKNLDEMYGI